MEMKIDDDRLQNILNALHFEFSEVVPPVGRAGGISLAWRKGFELEIVFSAQRCIGVLVHSDRGRGSWLMVCCYGPNRYGEQKLFWSQVDSLVKEFGGPWLLCGNLNQSLGGDEAEGGSSREGKWLARFLRHRGGLIWAALEVSLLGLIVVMRLS